MSRPSGEDATDSTSPCPPPLKEARSRPVATSHRQTTSLLHPAMRVRPSGENAILHSSPTVFHLSSNWPVVDAHRQIPESLPPEAKNDPSRLKASVFTDPWPVFTGGNS